MKRGTEYIQTFCKVLQYPQEGLVYQGNISLPLTPIIILKQKSISNGIELCGNWQNIKC